MRQQSLLKTYSPSTHENILRHPLGRQVTLMPAGNDFAMFRNSCPDAMWMWQPLPGLSRGPKRRSRWRRRLRMLPTEWGMTKWSMCGHVMACPSMVYLKADAFGKSCVGISTYGQGPVLVGNSLEKLSSESAR